MTAERPYRAAMPVAEAVERIVAEAGAQFDPRVVDGLAEGLARDAIPVGAVLEPDVLAG